MQPCAHPEGDWQQVPMDEHKGTRMQRCFSTTSGHLPAPVGSQGTCSAPALGGFAFCVFVHSSIYAAFYHPLHSWAKLPSRLGERKKHYLFFALSSCFLTDAKLCLMVFLLLPSKCHQCPLLFSSLLNTEADVP